MSRAEVELPLYTPVRLLLGSNYPQDPPAFQA